MINAFIPQGAPLYTVDFRHRVCMVVGWTRDPDEDGESGTWWNPVLVTITDLRPVDSIDTLGMGARTLFPLAVTDDSGGEMPYTPSLDEARKIAGQRRAEERRNSSEKD